MDDQLTAAERRALDAWVPFEPSTGFADRVVDSRVPEVRARRGQIAAIVLGLVAVAAIVAVIVTRRGGSEERSTVVTVPEPRMPEPRMPEPSTPEPQPAARPPAKGTIQFEIDTRFAMLAPGQTTYTTLLAKGTYDVAPGTTLRIARVPEPPPGGHTHG